MEIDFLKMRGCGDDVVLLDGARIPPETAEHLPDLARRILSRRFGVGGNALLLLGACTGGVLPVRCLDADGDDLPVSCNAARCAARYAADSGTVSTNDFSIESGSRAMRAQIIDSAHVRIDMGSPFGAEKTVEIRESLKESFTRSIQVQGRSVTYTPISLGRSYAMVFVPNFGFPVRRTAREIAAQPDFPDGTGIGFVQVNSREDLRVRIWDPPGELQADECVCASAALVAAVVNGFADRELFVHLPGGNIFLQWEESDNRIRLTGPAVYVFTGTFDYTPPSGE
jgi:diaminopimelate epimerase